MKGLKVFLQQKGWEIVNYNSDTTYLEAKIYFNGKDMRLIINKRLGVSPLYKSEWRIGDEVYYMDSNGDEKFIFEELRRLGF